jgi:inositol phosphorylceramide mannosyltransferase catalytic subunit
MIPKTLHQVWTSGNAFAPKYHEWRMSWMRHNPDWNFKLWTVEDIKDRMYECATGAWACVELLEDPALHWVLKSDIARWLAVCFEGGVYADCDVECVKPMGKFLSDPAFCGWSITPGIASNALFGGDAGNSLFLEIALAHSEKIQGHVEQANANICDYGVNLAGEMLKQCPKIWPAEFFNPFGSGNRGPLKYSDYPAAYTLHHWTGQDPDGWNAETRRVRPDMQTELPESVCVVKPRIIEGAK